MENLEEYAERIRNIKRKTFHIVQFYFKNLMKNFNIKPNIINLGKTKLSYCVQVMK